MIRDRLAEIVSVVFDGNAYVAAQAADVEPSTLHRILEGKVETPRLPTIRRLATAYGVPLGWMLGELSADAAQQLSAPDLIPDADGVLPTPFWLIFAYHRTSQKPLRDRMAKLAGKDKEMSLTIAEMLDFHFLPISDDFALPGLRRLLNQANTVTDTDIRIVRACAEFETGLLAYAVDRLDHAGKRGPKATRPADA